MADIISIPQIVWKILNITPQLLSQYRTPQDQLLWLIFIPNLLVIFWIAMFTTALTGGHKGFRNLFAIGIYLTFVLTGWYGRLIPLFITWWWIVIGLGVFMFLLSSVFKPGKSREATVLGGAIGMGAEKIFERREAQKRVNDLEKTLRGMGIDPNKEVTGQDAFKNRLGKEAQSNAYNTYKELQEMKRKAKEWY